MNADRKKRIAHEISNWKNACNCRAVQLTGDRMAALLQELIDAPEPKSCGWIRAIDEAMVTHHLGVADIVDDYEAAKKKLNTLLSLNQDIGEYFSAKAPAPSVPDEQLQAAFDRGLKAGNEQAIAQQIEIHKLHDLLAVQQPEQPTDLVRDAERYRWLRAALSDRTKAGKSHYFCSISEGCPEELDEAIDAAIEQQGVE